MFSYNVSCYVHLCFHIRSTLITFFGEKIVSVGVLLPGNSVKITNDTIRKSKQDRSQHADMSEANFPSNIIYSITKHNVHNVYELSYKHNQTFGLVIIVYNVSSPNKCTLVQIKNNSLIKPLLTVVPSLSKFVS